MTQYQRQWKGINCKQSTRWQHPSRLKASAFFSLQIFFSCYETQQLVLGTGTAIWWVAEPHYTTTVSLRPRQNPLNPLQSYPVHLTTLNSMVFEFSYNTETTTEKVFTSILTLRETSTYNLSFFPKTI